MTLSLKETLHNCTQQNYNNIIPSIKTLYTEGCYGQCCLCRLLPVCILMVSAFVLIVVMLRVILLSVFMLNVFMLCDILLCVIMLIAVMLSVIMLSVIEDTRHEYPHFMSLC